MKTVIIIAIGIAVLIAGLFVLVKQTSGNGIWCFDACGPCSSYGAFYVEVDGKCVLPDNLPVLEETITETDTIQDCNKKENVPDMACFIESYQNCMPAKIHQTRYTVEGDPISTTAIIEKTDPSKECGIHVYYDSKDRFGFQGKYDSLCSNMYAAEQFSWIINQCENKDHAFEIRKMNHD